jgi:hypothetical protein
MTVASIDVIFEKPKVQEPRKFFIIYKRDSAYDLAEHVHDGLHERGVDAFLDRKDLKEGLTQEEWRKQRDDALDKSEVVIVIVTHSCSSSDEVRYELKRARDAGGKDIKAFVDAELWNVVPEMTIRLNGESVNIRDFQVRRFDTRESLLRGVTNSTLIAGIVVHNQSAL